MQCNSSNALTFSSFPIPLLPFFSSVRLHFVFQPFLLRSFTLAFLRHNFSNFICQYKKCIPRLQKRLFGSSYVRCFLQLFYESASPEFCIYNYEKKNGYGKLVTIFLFEEYVAYKFTALTIRNPGQFFLCEPSRSIYSVLFPSLDLFSLIFDCGTCFYYKTLEVSRALTTRHTFSSHRSWSTAARNY